MKKFIKKYINDEIVLDKWQKIGVIAMLIVLSGIFGFLYEYIFYYFNGGMEKFYWRGGNFSPWINIYAIGAILILFFTNSHKKSPIKIFLLSILITGLLEYFSGLVIYKFFGKRFWDYNVEIWNFGNIQGYICLRSVLFFGLSALFEMYVMIPFIIFLATKMNKKLFVTISIILCIIVLCDEVYNLVISKILNTPNAIEIYKSYGLNFMNIIKTIL